jgi:hypothetical protein
MLVVRLLSVSVLPHKLMLRPVLPLPLPLPLVPLRLLLRHLPQQLPALVGN